MRALRGDLNTECKNSQVFARLVRRFNFLRKISKIVEFDRSRNELETRYRNSQNSLFKFSILKISIMKMYHRNEARAKKDWLCYNFSEAEEDCQKIIPNTTKNPFVDSVRTSRIRGALHARKRDFRFEKWPQTRTLTFCRSPIDAPSDSTRRLLGRGLDRRPESLRLLHLLASRTD